MDDHICPVCGAYGVSSREKAFIRLYGYVLTCHGCGAQLTVGFWESVVSLVPFFVFLCVGFVLDNSLGFIVCLVIGLLASWQWSIRFVPLVPTGRRPRSK